MTELTPNAEKLLREIIDNRSDDGECNTDYWIKRFDGINFAEDSLLRSTFKELSEAEMIYVDWAESVPYMLAVLNNGVSYFSLKDEAEKKAKKESRSGRRHDFIVLLIGTLLGAFLGALSQFLLYKVFGIGG